MSVWSRQVNSGDSDYLRRERMRTGRRLWGMWTLLLRDPDMSGSAAFLCRKVQSRGKISQEQNKCGHIFVKRSQCLWRLVSVSGTGLDYLETERGWKKYPPSCTVCIFPFHRFLPPVTTFAPQRSGLCTAVYCAPGANPSVHRSAPHMGSAHTSA